MTGTDPPSDPHEDLAGVLHDVSNVLTVLLGWVSEARSPAATPEAIAYAIEVIEQRARIARALARHAIGAPLIDEQREIGGLAQEIAQALRVEAQRSRVRLVLRGDDATAKVAGAFDLSQILTNLVLNALGHAPSDTSVEVSLSTSDEGCTILVSDQGPGVAQPRRESIFHGDSLRPGGTGVGLRHSRALARNWGGDVELLTPGMPGVPAKGATFRVKWPRVDAMPRPPTSSLRIQDLVEQRLLIIEDDAAVTQLLETVLEARGADVHVAMSPGELAEALASGPYDAILVDLSPLGDDPVSALARIRQSSPSAQLVLVTGQADVLPAEIDTSSVHLVRKPFEITEVLAVLRR